MPNTIKFRAFWLNQGKESMVKSMLSQCGRIRDNKSEIIGRNKGGGKSQSSCFMLARLLL